LDKSSDVTTFTTIKPPTAGNVLASFLKERSVHFGPNTLDFIPWIPRPFRYWNTQQCQDAIKRDDLEDDSIRFSKEKMRNKVLKAMVAYGMKDQQRFIKDTAQIKAKLTEIKNGTHIITMGSLEWALLKSKLDAIFIEYKSLPPHLQAMFQACYTYEDLEAFEMACEAQCDEWKIVEEASIEPVPEPKPETKPEPKPEPKFVEVDFPNSSRLDQFKQGIDFEKCREGRIQATTQRGKNKRAELVQKRRSAFIILPKTASNGPAAKPFNPLDISFEPDDDSFLDRRDVAQEVEPASKPFNPLDISFEPDDDSFLQRNDDVQEVEPAAEPFGVLDISSIESDGSFDGLDEERLSAIWEEESQGDVVVEVIEEKEPEFPSIGTIIVDEEVLTQDSSLVLPGTPQDDVVFDTAVEEPFDFQVETEEDQVTTVSDAEHESMVLFLAAFTTADVHVVEEDETPAPIASESPSTAPVIHEDDEVSAAEVESVDEPLLLESIISEQSNYAASRAMKELESTLDGYYWASTSESRSRRRRKQTNFFSPC